MARYDKMTYNPMTDEWLWEKYPRLNKFTPPENWNKKDFNTLFKAIIAFSDRESPLADLRSIPERWKAIYKDFDIKAESVVDTEIQTYGSMFQGLMHTYFMLLNDHEYETWLSLKIHFHQMNLALRESLFTSGNIERAITVRNNIARTLPQLKDDIIDIEARLFRDEYLQKMIAEAAVQDEIGGWAEKFAKLPEWAEN